MPEHPVCSEKTLNEAMQLTIEAVDRLIAESPRSLSDALSDVRDHFHEPGYSAGRLCENVGATTWLFTKFKRHVGLTPWRLIQELRMELGMRLLRDTSIYVKDVAVLVGYEEFTNFKNLCLAWCHLKPAALREQLRRVKRRLRMLPEEALTWRFWRRAVRGELSGEEARRLILYLEANLRKESAPAGCLPDSGGAELRPAPTQGSHPGLSYDARRAPEGALRAARGSEELSP